MTLLHPKVDSTTADELAAEALIQEARRLRRRRWTVALVALLLVGGIAVGVLYGVMGDSAGTSPVATAASRPFTNAKAFSHQGELAFVSRDALWVLDGSNSSLHEVTKNYGAEPVFSPDGKWLAYVTTGPPPQYGDVLRPPASQLWIARGNGTDAHRIHGLSNASDLAWSPTSDVLAVFGSAKPGITLVTPSGSARQLSATSHAQNFVWSPDGKEIAFAGYSQYGALQAISISGGTPVVWQAEHNNPAHPLSTNPTIPAKWLPHNEGILYWVDQDNSASIEADGLPLYEVSKPGSTPPLLGNTLVNSSVIAVSRNGALAIGAGGDRYQSLTKQVETCSAAAAKCSEVSMPSGDVSIDPSWSPDGKALIYATGPSANFNFSQDHVANWYSKLSLWIAEGGKAVELRGTQGGTNSSWSPNGKSLLFEANDGLWLMARMGSKPVEIAAPLFPPNDWPNYYAEINWTDQYAWSP